MNRFYIDRAFIQGERVKITDKDDVHHLVRVLRILEGEELMVSDGRGSRTIVDIVHRTPRMVELKIKQKLESLRREGRRIRISLACAVPRNARFEEVVDKGTQLGVDEIIPLFTERTLVKKDAFDAKSGRLKRVMAAAAKQSGVLFLPDLRESLFFEDLLGIVSRYDLRLLPNLSTHPMGLREAVSGFAGKRILVLIGPEGDFTESEISGAMKAGFQGISLGDSVLRVDTAAIAVVSYLKLYFDEP